MDPCTSTESAHARESSTRHCLLVLCFAALLEMEGSNLFVLNTSAAQPIASHDMTMALKDSAIKNNIAYHLGIVQSKDSFYGQHNPEKMPIAEELRQKWDAWVKGGVLCSEMEAATIFVVGSYRKVRTGAVLLVAGDQARGESLSKEEYKDNMSESVKMILGTPVKFISS